MITYNPLLCLDFYKTCHAEQYPKGLTKMVSYYTPRMSRLGDTDKVTLFGLQAFIQEYLIEAFSDHFFNVPFDSVLKEYNRVLGATIGTKGVGEKRLRELHDLGYLPLQVRAVPEGTRTNIRVPQIEIHTLTSYGWSTPSRRCSLAQCGIRKSPLRLGTDIVKSSMSMQNALAMTMWFVRDSLAIFLCAGKRALKVQQRAQQLSA